MTGTANAHDTHVDHPISASIAAIVLALLFAALFTTSTTALVDGPAVVVAVLLVTWSLVALWVLDRG